MVSGGAGDPQRGEPADHRDADHRERGGLRADHAAGDRAAQDGDIGAGLHHAGAAQHFVLLQMLGQDRIFDRAEERRMDAHADQRDEHQLQILEEDARGAHQHDADFGGLDDPHDLRLVIRVGELAGERGEEEEGQDEDAGGDGAEPGLGLDQS